MIWAVLAVLAVGLGLQAWVRLAPSDPARWHQPVTAQEDRDFDGGVVRIRPGDLSTLDRVARSWPRTEVLAGSVAEGRVTYVTRSRFWGFPDYTTVDQRGDQLAIYARLRFGRSDLGVNRQRVEAWLRALEQGQWQGQG